jgi:hypothetical protein
MFHVLLAMMTISSAAACDISFDCSHGKAMINGKSYPIVCGRATGRGMDSGEIGHVIRANGRWRPGLVAPGTPMITTSPQLCDDCFIHVSGLSFSNGCLGTTSAAFNVLKSCERSKFLISR